MPGWRGGEGTTGTTRKVCDPSVLAMEKKTKQKKRPDLRATSDQTQAKQNINTYMLVHGYHMRPHTATIGHPSPVVAVEAGVGHFFYNTFMSYSLVSSSIPGVVPRFLSYEGSLI